MKAREFYKLLPGIQELKSWFLVNFLILELVLFVLVIFTGIYIDSRNQEPTTAQTATRTTEISPQDTVKPFRY